MENIKVTYGIVVDVKLVDSSFYIKASDLNGNVFGRTNKLAIESNEEIIGMWIEVKEPASTLISTGSIPKAGDKIRITYKSQVYNGIAEIVNDYYNGEKFANPIKIGKDTLLGDY